MKKRTYIVATMAVAMAAFVGCQKDFDSMADFEKAGNAVERPVIGSVELTVGDAVTRAGAGSNGVVDSTGYNWQFEEGDHVGAALVDKVSEEDVTGYAQKDGTGAQWSYFEYVTSVPKDVDGVKNQLFTQTFADDQLVKKHTGEAFYEPDNDQIWTNYPYTAGAGAKVFTSQATLVEGHYVFYAPYNAGNGTRGPLMVTLPVKQTVKETSEGKSNSAVDEFFKGTAPAIVDMKYLSAADTKSVGSNLAALFAYPQFTIVNNYNGYLFDGTTVPATGTYLSTEAESKQYTMKIMQIELYPGEEKADAFTYKRALDVVKLYEAINKDNEENGNSQDRWYTDNSRKEFITAATAAVLNDESDYNVDTFDFKDETVKFEENIVKEFTKESKRIVLDFGEGKELAPGAKFTFNAVVPADNYTECGLYARILVEIEGAKYYILTNDVEGNAYNEKGKLVNMAKADGDYAGHAIVAKTGLTVGTDAYDYRFVDRKKHGSETVVLVRGQRYPAAEMNADQSAGPKTGIAGDLLTINLVGGQSQAAFAAYVEPEEEKKEDRGIFDNDEFIAYLQKVHNDAPLTQVRDYDEAEKDVNKFKLADENEVILDATLVKALAQAQQTQYTTFIDNLPIGEGVVVEAVEMDSTPYEFLFTTTVEGKEYSYTVKYEFEDDGKFNDKADALVSGINVITEATKPLAVKSGESNAVVFVKEVSEITIKNPAGINSINVEGEVTINVEATAEVTAPVVAPDATVVIKEGSKGLTNPENVFGAVENQALVAINFVDDKDNPVVVSYKRNGWGTTPIDAATKVNEVTINAASKDAILPTETASFDLVKNLTKVTIVFGDHIASLESAGETVKLGENIAVVKAVNTVKWTAKDPITGTDVTFNTKTTTIDPSVQKVSGVSYNGEPATEE